MSTVPGLPRQQPHPWDVICADHFATVPNESGIKHDANIATHPQRPLSPTQEYNTEEKKASYYHHACQIEQAHQLITLPYILATDPRVQDKSYHGIMSLVYKTWAKRVITYRNGLPSAPKAVKDLTEAQFNERASHGTHNEWLKKLANVVLDQLQTNHDYNTAADENVKRKILGRALLGVLRRWTNEWVVEPRALDPQKQYLMPETPEPEEMSGAPFSTVRPGSLARKGGAAQT